MRLEHRGADWLVHTDATPSRLANWPRKTFMARKLEVNCPGLKTNMTKEANIMATYKHFKLGNVVKAESNYGFDIVDEHKTPLFSNIYPTEVQAKAAHTAIATALANAAAVGTR